MYLGNRIYADINVISEIVCGIVNFKIKWKEEFITIP